MPATAVGKAKGRSMAASNRRRAGKAVARQRPGDRRADERREDGRRERDAERDASAAATRGCMAISTMPAKPEARGLGEQGRRAE